MTENRRYLTESFPHVLQSKGTYRTILVVLFCESSYAAAQSRSIRAAMVESFAAAIRSFFGTTEKRNIAKPLNSYNETADFL
jgi:hypothetical protein